MNILEQTRRRILFLLMIILAISWVIGYLFLNYQFKESIDEQIQTISNSAEKLFDLKVKEEGEILKFKLDRIVMADNLAEAVANSDYEKIHSIVSPYFNRLKKINHNIKILTFRSTDGITIYRAHKPEFYGDKLNKKRKLIVDTNNMQRSFSGFEVGKLEMTYRITQAIFYKDKYVGNVEIGVSPRVFLKDLNSIFKIDMGIAIDKSLSDIMIGNDKISIDNKYTLVKADKILKEFFQDPHELETFKVKMDIPLQNHLANTLGFLVTGFDISDIVEKNKNFMYKLFFIGVFGILFLSIVLHRGFNILLKHFTKQVFTDHLTGLLNRQALNNELYSGKSNVLILSNIKEFSLFNEFYGVDIANKVLKKVADAFEDFAPKYNLTVYKTSVDEYVLLAKESVFEEDKYDDIVSKLHIYISIHYLYILMSLKKL